MARLRGRDWISLGIICAAILASSREVVGGPSTPPAGAASPSQNELTETAPLISELKTTIGETSIEVFVVGWRPSSCHKTQEVLVTQEADATKIVIRMLKSAPPAGQLCSTTMEPMTIKVADLAKTLKSSYKIMALGHTGWHQHDITHVMPPGL